jgi:hypothetical protein
MVGVVSVAVEHWFHASKNRYVGQQLLCTEVSTYCETVSFSENVLCCVIAWNVKLTCK